MSAASGRQEHMGLSRWEVTRKDVYPGSRRGESLLLGYFVEMAGIRVREVTRDVRRDIAACFRRNDSRVGQEGEH